MTESEVVSVTGGASGIGAAVAKRFAAAGTRVVIADIDGPRGAAPAERIGARFVRTDVRIEADNDNMVDAAVSEFGRLDIVHLNAGVGYGGNVEIRPRALPPGDGSEPGRHHVRHPRCLAGDVEGRQKRHRGDLQPWRGIAPSQFDPFYSATKHAIIGLVRSLARGWEAGGSKVTLNAVCPGFVRTPILPDETWWRIAAMDTVRADQRTARAARLQHYAGPRRVWRTTRPGLPARQLSR